MEQVTKMLIKNLDFYESNSIAMQNTEELMSPVE